MDIVSLFWSLVARLAVLQRQGGRLARLLPAKGLHDAWRYLALAFILANLKSLPMMWHVSLSGSG